MKYLLYHLHSDYSLLDSCTNPQTYCDMVKRDGGTAIAFTEHGLPRGWVSKKIYCDSIGLKYIHGVEIYLTENLYPKIRDNYHTVLLARNLEGVKEINRLMELSTNEDHFYYTNRISFEEFLQLSDNVIKTSACLASPLAKLSPENPWFDRLLNAYTFLEIQPHDCDAQREFNRKLLEYSRERRIPLIAGTDTHNSSQYKAECRKIFMLAKDKSYGDEDSFNLTYMNGDELFQAFRTQDQSFPEEEHRKAIENTLLVEEMCEPFELDKTFKYPILNGSPEEDERLFGERCWRMLDEKLEAGIIPRSQENAFREAITEELRVFHKIGMGGFMLSMSDIIMWCKSQGMAIGTARGSVGGSRAAYVTDIIDLNPEQWHTVFSRFANEDRVEPGDIDVDVVDTDRPQIFAHIEERFGKQNTARVAAYGTLQDKSVIEMVAKALFKQSEDKRYALTNVEKIKTEFAKDAESAKAKWPELFYYFDGLVGCKTSQSVHPAGMVISPICLDDLYGVFWKDGERCLLLDMGEAHAVGLIKYDLLALKTVQVIRDTCQYIGKQYPKTNEINWDDDMVWDDVDEDQTSIFQFESSYSKECFKKFRPRNIFEVTMLTAAIRPSGQSYRNELIARKPHKNPSEMIDDLLKDNMGYLIYQEDTIKFLQQICGMSGSASDSVRRAIGKKDRAKIDKALPLILNGYCAKSPKPRQDAEREAKEFLKIIEDSASYQFGQNHAIAYSLLSYFCAFYRYYYPLEYTTAFLNNTKNDDDIASGIKLAQRYRIRIENPKFRKSRSGYFFDRTTRMIYRGVASVKSVGVKPAEQLYELGKIEHGSFMDVLMDIKEKTAVDSGQVTALIKIDYFSEYGNQRELLRIADYFYTIAPFNKQSISRKSFVGTELEPVISQYLVMTTKSGSPAVHCKIKDSVGMMHAIEKYVKSCGIPDLDDLEKITNFQELMGGAGYVSYKDEDRPKLLVTEVKPIYSKRDGSQWAYSIFTRSVGSGKEARFTLKNPIYDKDPVQKGDLIFCTRYQRDKQYFVLLSYKILASAKPKGAKRK